FQTVIPDLLARAKQAGVYLGVGPEQNFTYIAAVRPRMAFIIDIRRGNLQEHLLYKALLEMSADRADFLARLFSRSRPPGLGSGPAPQPLFPAYGALKPPEPRYRENLRTVVDWLAKRHGFALHPEDVEGIGYIYRSAFFGEGPPLGTPLHG